jgi:hypothetical protein
MGAQAANNHRHTVASSQSSQHTFAEGACVCVFTSCIYINFYTFAALSTYGGASQTTGSRMTRLSAGKKRATRRHRTAESIITQVVIVNYSD